MLARAYNGIFAMTALQVSGNMQHPTLIANLKLHGRTYHVVCGADSAPRAWVFSGQIIQRQKPPSRRFR